MLYEGITLTTLNKGPGHWPGTALPSQDGNVVVAGHRVTHSRPFRHIDNRSADHGAVHDRGHDHRCADDDGRASADAGAVAHQRARS